jgi:rod shape-determining protein MreC
LNFLPTHLTRSLAPLKSVLQRFAFSALLVMSVAIIVVGKADLAFVERLRTGTADVMAPVLGVLSQPVAAVSSLVGRVRDMADVYRENDRLRAENTTLLQWQQVARRLESENHELRGLTQYQPSAATWYVTGRVIGTAGGAYSRSFLIDRGSVDGVTKGQAAASGSGLVGRIAEVGERASRILLLTDLNSRIPVTLQDSHERAILAGDNSDRPMLVYLSPTAKPQIGEQIVTSGDGGVFPPGIPVGVISSTGSQPRVIPMTDLSTIDYVRIVDFGLSGVLPQSAVPAPKAPRKGQSDPATRP